MAQALRVYGQVRLALPCLWRSHFQQALDICIEYNDRYSQAHTYWQLGSLAEAQEDYGQAQQHLLQVLALFVEFKDDHSTRMTLRNLT